MIDIIIGARPNFMKVAPLIREFKKRNFSDYRLIHTGQHFDRNMSKVFFKDLNLPKPDINFSISKINNSDQTGEIMTAYEKVLKKKLPSLVIVVGDVNSTMAASIISKKFNLKLAHIEAGLRSNDLSMPEEINRIITDSISDYFFTTTDLASKNLIKMGFKKKNIFMVGNLMIDSLIYSLDKFINPFLFEKLTLHKKNFMILTMHRPKNVDDFKNFSQLLFKICKSVNEKKFIFPIHPRSKKNLPSLKKLPSNLMVVNPFSYNDFIYLLSNSSGVITDSGGITEEAAYLNIPCLTLRDNTERPETVLSGTNFLVGSNPGEKDLKKLIQLITSNKWKQTKKIPKWDGKTSQRIYKILSKLDFLS